jgi:beta-RFAP synthase
LKCVRVTTAARLHLGFLDLNGDLGRRFGSMGMSIDGFETCVELCEGAQFRAAGLERERAARLALRVADSLALVPIQTLNVSSAIPAHAGLGSGTQLAIAIAAAFRRFAGLPQNPLADARLLDRGARSGVGAALFERGGLVVDAGRGANTEMPPVIAHFAFPSDWRVLLILDPAIEGAHGESERRAFAALPSFPGDSAGEICRRVLMQILPAVVERDIAAFGDGLSTVQKILGDHFGPAQGGGRFTSEAVGGVADRLRLQGARGVGQSSWGPTGFAFASDPDEADFLVKRARDDCASGVEIKICKARNRGAAIDETSMF